MTNYSCSTSVSEVQYICIKNFGSVLEVWWTSARETTRVRRVKLDKLIFLSLSAKECSTSFKFISKTIFSCFHYYDGIPFRQRSFRSLSAPSLRQ